MSPSLTEAKPSTEIYIVNLYATNGGDFVPPEGTKPLFTEESRAQNIANLRDRLVGKNAYKLKVRAGDGTLGWIIEAAVDSGREVEIEADLGGNKNDMAVMAAKAGGRIAIRPLLLERKNDDNEWERERMVGYSFGLGGAAVGAAVANSGERRKEQQGLIEHLDNSRWPNWLVAPKFWGSIRADIRLYKRLLQPEVQIGDKTYPTSAVVNGKRIGAMIVSSGNIMSGGWLKFWQKLHERGFVTATIGNSWLARRILPITRTVKLPGLSDRWTIGTGEPFEVSEDALAQADGEDFEIQKGLYRLRELGKTAVTLSVTTR